MHYGVLGMKWGKRKDRASLRNQKRYNKQLKKLTLARTQQRIAKDYRKVANAKKVNPITRTAAKINAYSYDRRANRLLKSLGKKTIYDIELNEDKKKADYKYQQAKAFNSVLKKHGLKPLPVSYDNIMRETVNNRKNLQNKPFDDKFYTRKYTKR